MGRFRPSMLIVTLLLSGSFVTARARCLQVWLTRVRRSRGTCKFPEKYQRSMQRCTKLAKQKDLENFEIFLQIARDGSVQKILVSPQTRVALCLRRDILKGTFRAPPSAGYWIRKIGRA